MGADDVSLQSRWRLCPTGCGMTAEAIVALARENGVYVHQSTDLVNLLLRVDQDKFIPPELYRAVAELLAWLYQLEKKSESVVYMQHPG